MENSGRHWDSRQPMQLQRESSGAMGPMYYPVIYAPPAINQSDQNLPSQFSFPPPPLPPCVPPPLQTQQSCNHQLKSVIDTVEIRALKFETNDSEWVANWLRQRNFYAAPKQECSSTNTKLIDVREMLLQCLSGIKELRQQRDRLSACSDSADKTQWSACFADAGQKKAEVSLLLAKLQSVDLVTIKRKLLKRTKKRDRLRRKRVKQKEAEQTAQARRRMLHQRADVWLAEMRLTVEREHREDELRREADAVLGEVTRKQTEAKRQLLLLDALIKLRQARVQRAMAHSSAQDVEADRSSKKFSTVVERLQKLWKTQLKEYAAEERGLRVMLQESAEQKSDARCKRVRSIVDLWKRAIFGEGGADSQMRKNISELIATRKEWDRFVVPPGVVAPVASTIPVGWVLPHGPTSALWRTYCVAYDKGD